MPRQRRGFPPILGRPAASAKPCECALDNPAAGEVQSPWPIGSLDDFQRLYQPSSTDPLACRPHNRQRRRYGQAMARVPDRLKKVRRAIPIPKTRAVEHEVNHRADCLDTDVVLAPFDLLARIIAANAAAFCDLDVSDYQSRQTMARLHAPRVHRYPGPENGLKDPEIHCPPRVEIALYRRIGWRVPR